MFTLFYKTIFSMFLTFMIALCLMYFFDNGGYIFPQNININYSDKYFGFSTLYQWFTYGFVEDSSLISNMRVFINRVAEDVRMNLYGKWYNISATGGIYDIVSFFNAFTTFFTSIFAIFEMIFYILLLAVYVLMIIFWGIIKMLQMFSGYWISVAPPYTYA